MINHLKHMAIFAHVIEQGSFRAAAQKLGLAPSRISESVSQLEEFLGATLLYRSTRKITLTSDGTILYSHVADMLKMVESGLDELNSQSTEPTGTLRISLPAFLAGGPLSTAVAKFVTLHPRVKFSVSYSDYRMRLVEDGFDMKISIGSLDDSNLMSRKLAECQCWLVAGTDYASQFNAPKKPEDLIDWNWINFIQRSDRVDFLSSAGNLESLTCHGQIQTDSMEAVYRFALDNMGVTILPSFLAERGIADGKLVRLLPESRLTTLGMYAVWADTSRRQSLTLMFVRFLSNESLY